MVTIAEKKLARALARTYQQSPISRSKILRDYTVTCRVLQRHATTAVGHSVFKMFATYTHVLTYPNPGFIRLFNELWGGINDTVE